jgi:suppressor of G2 allele of SKP1
MADAESIPLPCRTDTYQTVKNCAAVIYTRGYVIDNVEIKADSRSIRVELEIDGETYSKVFTFYAEIDPDTLKIDKGKVKIEASVVKMGAMMWPQVEANPEEIAPLYQKWRQVTLPPEEEEKLDVQKKFLKTLWEHSDDDARRAMEKSMYESHGTVISGNWGQVKDKKTEPFKSEEQKQREKEDEERLARKREREAARARSKG